MGGCASRPKDLDTETAPAPVEVPSVATEEPVAAAVKAKPESATQEKTDEVEATAPLVDLSEPAEVAPKTEETKEEVVPVETESKPTESEAKVVVEANEEKKEVVA